MIKVLRFLLLLFFMYLIGQFYAASKINQMRSYIESSKSEQACIKEHDWAGRVPRG